ncbi:hypothetical protein GCM10011506_02330 [Marivirga lumbricoides]|uniref:DUF5683 domain-containing protein n=1 Tax=Marivirga lumbricoides TaxID=1046115 RepID=A0ABQ1L7R0_9BACT|nr:hypothetical protein GCM10011506_02330 [Marivirga lumbricoides]
MRNFFLLLFILSVSQLKLFGQETATDTLLLEQSETIVTSEENIETFETKDKDHSPRLAALYSAAIPGLGQFYNEKYWKIPIVYALGAFAAYQIKNNHQNFLFYRNAAFKLDDLDPTNNDEVPDVLGTSDNVNRRTDLYRRDRDYWIILAGLFYVLNIVDATVDAHLREFNINEDLSLNFEPTIQRSSFNGMHAGLSLNLKFK